MKTCNLCKEEKPISNFYTQNKSNNLSGRQNYKIEWRMIKMRNVFPFVEKPADIEKVKSSNIYLAVADAEKGDLKKLKAMYKDGYVFGSEYLINGGYKLLGWYFDLKPYCKNYLVKLKHYGWKEYSTPNKTCLYKMIGRHNVLEIIEK